MFNTLQDERDIYIAAQLPDNSKARNNFLFFLSPHIFLTCLFYRCSCLSWTHFCTEAGSAASIKAGQENFWELPWWLITSTRLDFIGRSSIHRKCSLSGFLQHALSLKWQRQHTAYYPIPLRWWQIYSGISFQMLNGGFSPESEWFPVSHPLPPPSADVCLNCKNTESNTMCTK